MLRNSRCSLIDVHVESEGEMTAEISLVVQETAHAIDGGGQFFEPARRVQAVGQIQREVASQAVEEQLAHPDGKQPPFPFQPLIKAIRMSFDVPEGRPVERIGKGVEFTRLQRRFTVRVNEGFQQPTPGRPVVDRPDVPLGVYPDLVQRIAVGVQRAAAGVQRPPFADDGIGHERGERAAYRPPCGIFGKRSFPDDLFERFSR